MSSFLAPDFGPLLDHLLQLYSQVWTSSKNCNLQQAAKKNPTQNPILSLNIQAFMAYRKPSLSCKDVKLQRQQETAAGWIMNLCRQSCSPPRCQFWPHVLSSSECSFEQTESLAFPGQEQTLSYSLASTSLAGVSVWIGGPHEPRAQADELRGF